MNARSWAMVERVAWIGIVGLVLGLIWYVTQGLSQKVAPVVTTQGETASPTVHRVSGIEFRATLQAGRTPAQATQMAERQAELNALVTPESGCTSQDVLAADHPVTATFTLAERSRVGFSGSLQHPYFVGSKTKPGTGLYHWVDIGRTPPGPELDAITVFEPGSYTIQNLNRPPATINIIICPIY